MLCVVKQAAMYSTKSKYLINVEHLLVIMDNVTNEFMSLPVEANMELCQ